MYLETAGVWNVVEFHEVRDKELFNELVESMEENGWQGRPLVVIDCGGNEYRALTGSHRLAAARKACLEVIPVACIECDEMFEDYDITGDDLKDPDQIYNMLSEYDEEAAELFRED